MDIFPGHKIIGWQGSPTPSTLKMFYCLQLPLFLMEKPATIHLCSHNMYFIISGCFQNFLLWFSAVWVQCAYVWFSLYLTCSGFAEISESVHLCYTDFGKSSTTISSNFFCPFPFLLSYWYSNCMYVRPFHIVPWVTEVLFTFSPIFVLQIK